MKKNELEKLAASMLEKHPSKDAVYMTEDGQGFFNKDARNNHAKSRGGLKVSDFFREGVPTPQETTDAVKALEVATEKVLRYEAANEVIEKVLTDDAFEITVTTETDPMIALVVNAKEQLEEAKGLANEAQNLENTLSDKTNEVDDLKVQLSEKDVELEKASKDLKAENDTIKAKDVKITALESELEKTKKALATAKKTK